MMLEIYKDVTEKNKAFGTLLRDVPKTFDYSCHDLLITKLQVLLRLP